MRSLMRPFTFSLMRPRSSRVRFLVATLLLVASAACSSATEPVNIDGVTAVSRDGRVRVTNGTTTPVFVFVIGRNSLALADWYPCVDAAICPPIQPGATRSEPVPEGETEAAVYWWRAQRGLDGVLRPMDMHSAIITL